MTDSGDHDLPHFRGHLFPLVVTSVWAPGRMATRLQRDVKLVPISREIVRFHVNTTRLMFRLSLSLSLSLPTGGSKLCPINAKMKPQLQDLPPRPPPLIPLTNVTGHLV